MARKNEHDKQGKVLSQLIQDAGYLQLQSIPTREKAVEFYQEYLKRTGKDAKQGSLV